MVYNTHMRISVSNEFQTERTHNSILYSRNIHRIRIAIQKYIILNELIRVEATQARILHTTTAKNEQKNAQYEPFARSNIEQLNVLCVTACIGRGSRGSGGIAIIAKQPIENMYAARYILYIWWVNVNTRIIWFRICACAL